MLIVLYVPFALKSISHSSRHQWLQSSYGYLASWQFSGSLSPSPLRILFCHGSTSSASRHISFPATQFCASVNRIPPKVSHRQLTLMVTRKLMARLKKPCQRKPLQGLCAYLCYSFRIDAVFLFVTPWFHHYFSCIHLMVLLL